MLYELGYFVGPMVSGIWYVIPDAAFWTEPIAAAAGELAQTFQKDAATRREIWLVGEASPRFKDGMKALGWAVHDHWQPAPG